MAEDNHLDAGMYRSETLKGDSNEQVHLENIPSTPRDLVFDTSPANPQNWPAWKKDAQILMVAFHSMVATFMAAGIIPAYDVMAEAYAVTVPQASYLTSAQVCLHPVSTTALDKESGPDS